MCVCVRVWHFGCEMIVIQVWSRFSPGNKETAAVECQREFFFSPSPFCTDWGRSLNGNVNYGKTAEDAEEEVQRE